MSPSSVPFQHLWAKPNVFCLRQTGRLSASSMKEEFLLLSKASHSFITTCCWEYTTADLKKPWRCLRIRAAAQTRDKVNDLALQMTEFITLEDLE
uniref:Uncharacterized protein n=1 Tax=Zonotrichia albicollis TaxID=44394 RepID=A0A8D2MB14_ZONAL